MNPQAIYMDVGCWQGKEDEEPTMTFGLMAHNAIALCSYYSSGDRTDSIPYTDENLQFDFRKSLIYEFLNLMTANKYGVGSSDNDTLTKCADFHWPEYHIEKIIPFASRSLLSDENMLHIFIPDLHLHYFKDTYLDNFVTSFGNEIVHNRPVKVKLPASRSMVNEFATFLKTIIQFQQRRDAQSRVIFLGDLCEMWGTNAVIRHNCLRNIDIISFYRGLNELKEHIALSLTNVFEGNKTLVEYAIKLKQLRIDKLPIDPRFTAQISILRKDKPLIRRLAIDGRLSPSEIRQKARTIESEILKKHRDKNGDNLKDLVSMIKRKVTIVGNHDNYHQISNMTSLLSFNMGAYNIRLGRFDPVSLDNATNSMICYGHGHNLDPHNNDDYCGTGHLLTILLTFFEAKKQGDMFKKYDRAFRNTDVRMDNIQSICRIFHRWEQKDSLARDRNKVMILAHTHSPYLEDISEDYFRYLLQHQRNQNIVVPNENIMEWPRQQNIGPLTIE